MSSYAFGCIKIGLIYVLYVLQRTVMELNNNRIFTQYQEI